MDSDLDLDLNFPKWITDYGFYFFMDLDIMDLDW